jgi:hypothetical protein
VLLEGAHWRVASFFNAYFYWSVDTAVASASAQIRPRLAVDNFPTREPASHNGNDDTPAGCTGNFDSGCWDVFSFQIYGGIARPSYRLKAGNADLAISTD